MVCLLFIISIEEVSAKPILLRNERIETPAKAGGPNITAQAVLPATSGLFLIQLESKRTPEWAAALKKEGVELIRPIPTDAYVAKFSKADLGRIRVLPFVTFVGKYEARHKVHEGLAEQAPGPAQFKQRVSLLVASRAAGNDLAALKRLAPKAVIKSSSRFGKVLEAEVLNTEVMNVAQSEAVLWMEPASSIELFDEAAVHIIGGEAEEGKAHVHELGFDGSGVVVAVADSGLQDGVKEGMHPDLAGRVDAFFHYGNLEDASDEHSHGTHVTGIVAGDGSTGEMDEYGYLYGLGIAPKTHIVAQRIFDGLGGYEAPETFEQLTRDAVRSGAVIGSNSWGDDTHGRYDISAMEFDALVRDADSETPGDQQYILEFSAGNAGPGERTIGSPAVAKNVIATGASQNNRFDMLIYADGQEYMADFSSRGPTEDGRIKPDIVAPGTWIASLQSSSASDENSWGPISPNYQYQGGTSQAGPQVSGGAALFVQYYRSMNNGRTPSPALTKAALINSTVPLEPDSGRQSVPNMDEGWGRMDLTEIIGSEKRFDYTDQTANLASGQVFEKHFVIASRETPLKITLAYTDVPGFPPAIPALVNDLDLELVAPNGMIYRGNQFLNGESVPQAQGSDSLNNVEGIFISAPEVGEYTVRVRASAVQEDARRDTAEMDQDFALVVSGLIPMPGQGVVAMDKRFYRAPDSMGLKLIDFDLAGQQSALVQVSSSSQPQGFAVNLQSVGRAGVFTGVVQIASMPVSADGRLHVAHGDTIQVSYQDASPAATVTSTAKGDFQAPIISDISTTNRFGRQLVLWTTDEPANSTVFFRKQGETTTNVSQKVYVSSHEVNLGTLETGARYEYYVVSNDEAGNVSTNNNNGLWHSFEASGAATVLLVNAYVHSPDAEAMEIPVTGYTDALDQTGVSYEVWNTASNGSPTLTDLSPYRVVIWRINDSFYEVGNTLSPIQQTLIQDYLNNNGSFLMASMDILSRLADSSFRTNVLHVAEFKQATSPFEECFDCDEDFNVAQANGSASDLISSGMELVLDYSQYPVFELEPIAPNIGPDLSDVFVPTTNAAPIFFESTSGRVTGIKYPRSGKDSAGRVVFMAFPLDAIPLEAEAPNNRVTVLMNILTFLAPGIQGRGTLSLDQSKYKVPSQVTVEVADTDLTSSAPGSVSFTNARTGASVIAPLEPTARPGVFRAFITLTEGAQLLAAFRLAAEDGDSLLVEYNDESTRTSLRAAALVDAIEPSIFGIEHYPDYEVAEILWETSEPTDALVQFGESKFLGRTAYSHVQQYSHSLYLTALQPNKLYYYQVVSRDEAGNVVVDDNGGEFYTFQTLKPFTPPWSDALDEQGDWLVQDGEDSDPGWQLGTPNNMLATSAHSPEYAWGSNLNDEPRSFVQSFLISPAVELTGGNQATLKFWHNYDFMGDATFEQGTLYIYTNAIAEPIILRTYSEFTFEWEEEEIDLTSYLGHVVQFVWSYEMLDFTFENNQYPGWLIDDVSVDVQNVQRGRLVITNNLAQANFTIEGPSPDQASGKTYLKQNALVGDYVITFNPVPYYQTPAAVYGTLASGQTLAVSGVYGFTDENKNGMSDEWEQEFFQEVSSARSISSDTDGDGFTDHAEFLAGTNPNDVEQYFAVTTPIIFPDGRVMLEWNTIPGRSYRVLGSTNGVDWTPYSGWLNGLGETAAYTVSPQSNVSAVLFQVEVSP
ncbi:MAG: S8 family serine peptidase [Verrucomicrobiales bacterium]